jgi:hypothetical protein
MRFRMAFILALLSVALADAAAAGPWAREKGTVFVSLSAERDRDGNNYTGLYGEYGLTPRHTLGFELGHSNAGESSVMIWSQRALDRGRGPDRLTVSTGFGVLKRDGKMVPLVQAGASWGRGFDGLPLLRQVPGGGWLAVDARVKLAQTDEEEPDRTPDANGRWSSRQTYLTPKTTAKAEVTLGWHATSSLMLINQLRFEDRDDTGFSGKLATSVVRDLAGPAKIELGLIVPFAGEGELAIKIGTWIQF